MGRAGVADGSGRAGVADASGRARAAGGSVSVRATGGSAIAIATIKKKMPKLKALPNDFMLPMGFVQGML